MATDDDDLEWVVELADLVLGTTGYQDSLWPLFFEARTARLNGECARLAEERLLEELLRRLRRTA